MKFPYVLLLAFPLVLACSRPEYDISEGVNTEITLFENEISVPIGSAGPFSLGMVFDKLAEIEGVGEFFSEYLKVNPDGFIYTDDAGSIYEANVYELEKEIFHRISLTLIRPTKLYAMRNIRRSKTITIQEPYHTMSMLTSVQTSIKS